MSQGSEGADRAASLLVWNPKGPHVWREPPEETADYPGLTLCDNRVSGSINIGPSRLPIWAIIHAAIHGDWHDVESGWSPGNYGFTADDLSGFLYFLLEQRGEFGRLLMILADVERIDNDRDDAGLDVAPWWQQPDSRDRVISQLERCLAVLRNPSSEVGAS